MMYCSWKLEVAVATVMGKPILRALVALAAAGKEGPIRTVRAQQLEMVLVEKEVPRTPAVSVALVAAPVETEMVDSVEEEVIAQLQMVQMGGGDFPPAAKDVTMEATEVEVAGG
eukprot:g4274.t1